MYSVSTQSRVIWLISLIFFCIGFSTWFLFIILKSLNWTNKILQDALNIQIDTWKVVKEMQNSYGYISKAQIDLKRDTLKSVNEVSKKLVLLEKTLKELKEMDSRLYRSEKLLSRLTAKLAPLAPDEKDFPYF